MPPAAPKRVSLSGTGAAPAVSLSPTSLTFASQTVGTSSTAQAVTLTNSGNAALSVTSVAVSGTNASDFAQTNTCGQARSGGANCTISVTFTPIAAGTRTATSPSLTMPPAAHRVSASPEPARPLLSAFPPPASLSPAKPSAPPVRLNRSP